jgi:hypothetical protein
MLANIPAVHFGLGGVGINPHEFIIVAREGYDRFCIFITTLRNDNDERDIKGGTKGSSMPIQSWFDNHFEKEDWHCLHGDIQKDQNGKMNIICEKFSYGKNKNNVG